MGSLVFADCWISRGLLDVGMNSEFTRINNFKRTRSISHLNNASKIVIR